MEAAAGFEPAHNGFAVRSLNHLGTPPYAGRTHTYTTRTATRVVTEAFWSTSTIARILRAPSIGSAWLTRLASYPLASGFSVPLPQESSRCLMKRSFVPKPEK